jgi:hypothetical protein
LADAVNGTHAASNAAKNDSLKTNLNTLTGKN